MEENNKNINIDINSQTIEKAIDKLAVPVYNDLVHKPMETIGDSINTVLKFFNNMVLYPMQKYNIYAENKLKNYAAELQKKSEMIPKENLIEPRVNILGPTIDGLKYNLDEKHIKEMFTNIITSEIDNRKQNKVLPSYIEIVKQLSCEDAQFLKHLKINKMIPTAPIIQLRVEDTINYSYEIVSDYIICKSNGSFMITSPIVIDNLLRLKIIKIPHGESIYNIPDYEKTFESIKLLPKYQKYTSLKNKHLDKTDSILALTDFGKNFIDICLS